MSRLPALLSEGRTRFGDARLESLREHVLPVEDLELVYALVRAQRPLLVLEADTGPGLFAAAIACALEENGRGGLWSFARGADVEAATALWSSLGLSGRIQLHKTPLADFLDEHDGVPFDLVVSDGARSQADVARLIERGLLQGLLVVHSKNEREAAPSPSPSVALSPRTCVAHVRRSPRVIAATPRPAEVGAEAARAEPISLALLEGLTPSQLEKCVDFSRLREPAREFLPPAHVAYMNDPPGREHYKLLAFLSSLVGGRSLMDIGTLHGSSALALSYGSGRVVSFDIERVHRFPDRWGSIDFFRGDVLRPGSARETFKDAIPLTPLILLDVDPHEGEQERQFLTLLEEVGFRGCLVLDDIHLNEEMERFWDSIDRPKVDLTACGHTTGTGCVLFVQDTGEAK